MDWTETYLNQNDLNQMMWNIDWESDEPKEVVQYLFEELVEMRQLVETEEVRNLVKENQKLKEQLEASEKARKEASNILKDYIPDEYIRSCDTSDGIGRYELDTESWQYKIYEILDIDKGE